MERRTGADEIQLDLASPAGRSRRESSEMDEARKGE